MSKLIKPSVFYANAMLLILSLNVVLCFVLWGLFFLIIIGAWQVLDAVFWLVKGDKRRRTYLLTVVLYFILMGVGALFMKNIAAFNSNLEFLTSFFYVIVVPYGIAFWYWYITREHARSDEISAQENSGALDDLNNIA